MLLSCILPLRKALRNGIPFILVSGPDFVEAQLNKTRTEEEVVKHLGKSHNLARWTPKKFTLKQKGSLKESGAEVIVGYSVMAFIKGIVHKLEKSVSSSELDREALKQAERILQAGYRGYGARGC